MSGISKVSKVLKKLSVLLVLLNKVRKEKILTCLIVFLDVAAAPLEEFVRLTWFVGLVQSN